MTRVISKSKGARVETAGRLKVLAVTFLIVLFVVLCCIIEEMKITAEDFDGFAVETVAQGDVLWNMADKHCPKGFDKREYIQLIRDVNGMDGDDYIYPGQNIVFPVVYTRQGVIGG